MEKENKILTAINSVPTEMPLKPSKILMDRFVHNGQVVTEERKKNVKALLS